MIDLINLIIKQFIKVFEFLRFFKLIYILGLIYQKKYKIVLNK